jgi:hypothetical protein
MEDAALQRVIAQLDAVTVELRAMRGIHAVVSPMCPPKTPPEFLAFKCWFNGAPYGIRTRVSALRRKGRHMTSTDDGLRGSGYWHERAEEVRSKAEEMHSGDAQSAMLDIAAMYDRMAKRVAEREAKHKLA